MAVCNKAFSAMPMNIASNVLVRGMLLDAISWVLFTRSAVPKGTKSLLKYLKYGLRPETTSHEARPLGVPSDGTSE